MNDPQKTPVIIGVSQITDTTSDAAAGRSPLQLMAAASRLAADDAGVAQGNLSALESITVIRSFSDTIPAMKSPFGDMVNAPWSVGQDLGANPRDMVYPQQGGDTPQLMVERAFDKIAAGEVSSALVVGAEALRTERNAVRAGLTLDWSADAPCAPDQLAGLGRMYLQTEEDHGMRSAVAMYALFEQALRARKGLTLAQRNVELGNLFKGFADVAHANPYATRNEGYTADEIRTVSSSNRYAGFPYTRLMVANMYVDQAAAVLICSQAQADAWNVPQDKRVYLHASAHAHDEWFVSERNHFDRAPAIGHVARDVLGRAGIGIGDVSFFDLYSCFASAIEIAAEELGLSIDDPRGLTVTGGLPFFGGPGNNYVTHAIAETVSRVRARSGSYGLVTANGGLLTKQAAGLYSAVPPRMPWKHADDARIQAEVDAASGPKVELLADPAGEGVVETFTTVHGRSGPERGIIIGRLTESGRRFVANTPTDPATLSMLEEKGEIGMKGHVTHNGKTNEFVPVF